MGTGNCLISGTLNTVDYDNQFDTLDLMKLQPGYIQIMIPADATTLSLSISPSNGSAILAGDLFQEAFPAMGMGVATCASPGAGQACDFGSVDVSAYAGTVMTVHLYNSAATYVYGASITISLDTAGIAAPMSATNTWPPAYGDDAGYVLWPVGPATGTFSYGWSETTASLYSIGVMDPTGLDWSETDVATPAMMGSWPTSGSPPGWYMFSTSTYYLATVGETWTFTITP
jgi:hypothetical protein